MAQVYVSIGSNIEPEKNIVGAVRALRQQYRSVVLSPVYQSAAVGFKGGDFLNLVAEIDTSLTLEQIKSALLALEKQFGRNNSHKGFQSRTLDLDLLLYDDVIRHDAEFDLPRAEIEQHAFVLKPLSDLAPDKKHPEVGKILSVMWRDFSDDGLLTPYALALD